MNYRATQKFGSETLYGSYYAAGDTVGVLLDMDHGTIAFVKDGEDFNVGKMVVKDLGIAYHNLRRSNRYVSMLVMIWIDTIGSRAPGFGQVLIAGIVSLLWHEDYR